MMQVILAGAAGIAAVVVGQFVLRKHHYLDILGGALFGFVFLAAIVAMLNYLGGI